MHRHLLIAITATTLSSLPTTAPATFVDGVEHFTGTTVDSTTWRPYFFGNGAATVSNGYLDLTGQYYLITKTHTVGVGQTIAARVMLTAPSSDGTSVSLGLTSVAQGALSQGSRAYVSLLNSIQGESYFNLFSGTGPSASGTGGGAMSNNVGTWYRITLQRNSPSAYTAQLFSDAGSLLSTQTQTFTALPSQAYVFLGLGPTARFDWVSIPEPSTALLTLAAAVPLASRRRHPRNPRA